MSRIGVAASVFVLLAGCGAPSARGPEVPAQSSAGGTADPSAAPASPASESDTNGDSAAPAVVEEERDIYIDEVVAENPLTIRGRARTFENNVAVRARGADGKVIAEGFTTSRGEMGRHNPFEAKLWLTREPGRTVVVEALEYSAKDGSEQSVARIEKAFGVASIDAKVFFPDEGCTGVRAFSRRMPKTVAMARLLVEALVSGPTPSERASGASSPFPQGSAVRSVILRDGVITVDFNERLQNVGGSCRAEMIRKSVTAALTALPAVKRVIITAAGSEPLALQP
jgi:hypothetical protein